MAGAGAVRCVMGLADSIIEQDLGIDGSASPFSTVPASADGQPAQIGLRFRPRNPEGPPEQPAVEIATRFQFSHSHSALSSTTALPSTVLLS